MFVFYTNTMNNTINNTISFGSRIQVSRLAYANEIIKKLNIPSIDAPWTIYQSKYLKNGYSEDASYCTMGVIKNEFGDGFMFHLRPGASSIKKIFEHLFKAVGNLKYSKNLTGILVGGNADYKPSAHLYTNLQSMFKELNIKYSALLGQKNQQQYYPNLPYCNMFFDGLQDKYIIYSSRLSNTPSQISKMHKIYDIFDTVIINKNDNIIIN